MNKYLAQVAVCALIALAAMGAHAQYADDGGRLDIRDAIMYLSRTHNRGHPMAFKVSLGLGTQLPMVGIADTVDPANPKRKYAFDVMAAWFYELRPSISFFYHLEAYAIVGLGMWSSEANIDPSLLKTQTLDMRMLMLGAGAKYRFLRGDIVPFVTAFGGMAPVTATAFQPYIPKRQETVSASLLFAGGGAGIDVYITPHFGATIQAAYTLYLNTTKLQAFRDPSISPKPVFVDGWGNIAFNASLFYEF